MTTYLNNKRCLKLGKINYSPMKITRPHSKVMQKIPPKLTRSCSKRKQQGLLSSIRSTHKTAFVKKENIKEPITDPVRITRSHSKVILKDPLKLTRSCSKPKQQDLLTSIRSTHKIALAKKENVKEPIMDLVRITRSHSQLKKRAVQQEVSGTRLSKMPDHKAPFAFQNVGHNSGDWRKEKENIKELFFEKTQSRKLRKRGRSENVKSILKTNKKSDTESPSKNKTNKCTVSCGKRNSLKSSGDLDINSSSINKSKIEYPTNSKISKYNINQTVLKNKCSKVNPVNVIRKEGNGKRKNILIRKSDSFEKYGMITPSYDQIVGNIKSVEDEAKALNNFEDNCEDFDVTLPNSLKALISCDPSPCKPLELLDCKHLTSEEIKRYFDDNLEYVTNIFKGVIFSERHNRYENYNVKYNLTLKDLAYSSSIVVYTDCQRDYLLDLLEQNIDPDGKHTEYIFKVLLPELCVKIFMDVHSMTNQKATEYLDRRPLD